MMGLFGPEMVVYVAWRQYKSASLLTSSMNEVFKETHQKRKHPWTIIHSFYAGMGGFVIETADPLEEPYISGSPRLSLGSRGVLFVARHGGHILDVSKAFIFDRSKADKVGKCLVCLQAGWAIVECISRLVNHLSLTLLEINTLGHVLCALLMYLFWLRKPLDVNEATVLTGKWTRPMCAWLLMSNYLSWGPKKPGIELSDLYVYPMGTREKPPLNGLSPIPAPSNYGEHEAGIGPDGTVSEAEADSNEAEPVLATVSGEVHIDLENAHTAPVPLQEFEILSGTVFALRSDSSLDESCLIAGSRSPVRTVDLDQLTITRWKLASSFISDHWDVFGIDPAEGLPEGPLRPNASEFNNLIMLEVPDWPGLDQLSEHTMFTFAKLCTATALYGGLHAGAWNSAFPSAAEGLLWKISAVLITGSGLSISMVAVFKHLNNQGNWKQVLRSYACRFLAMVPEAEWAAIIEFSECTARAYVTLIIVPVFIVARLYLIAEAFASLRALPIEAYQTPIWTQWIPHL
jgi:hypothetical protein